MMYWKDIDSSLSIQLFALCRIDRQRFKEHLVQILVDSTSQVQIVVKGKPMISSNDSFMVHLVKALT
jgi:hypothetical protein